MALERCAECGREMSSEAAACPGCGRPNPKARNRAMDEKQRIGCGLMALAIIAAVISPSVGGVIFVVGLVLFLVYTRVW